MDLKGKFLEHLAQVGELEARDRQGLEQCLIGADLAVPAQHQQVDRLVVEVRPVVREPAAVGVQGRHQGQQQRVASQGRKVGTLPGGEQVGHLVFTLAGREPVALDQRPVPAADELLDPCVVQVRQGIDALSGVRSAGPGVGPGGEQETALGAGRAHELLHRGEHALLGRAAAAFVESVEQDQGTAGAGDPRNILEGTPGHAVAGGMQVRADEVPEVAGPDRPLPGREPVGEAAQQDADREQCAVRPGLAQPVEFGAVALPSLGECEQQAGAEGALAAAGLAEQGQRAVAGEGLEGGDRPHLVPLFGRVEPSVPVPAGQPFRQRLALGDRGTGVQGHIDIGELQRLAPGLLRAQVDLAEPQAREIGDQGVQIECDDRLGLLRVLADLDDLGEVLDVVPADDMAATGHHRAGEHRPAGGLDPGAGIDVPTVVAGLHRPLAECVAAALGNGAGPGDRAGQGRLLHGGQLRLKLGDLPLQRRRIARP